MASIDHLELRPIRIEILGHEEQLYDLCLILHVIVDYLIFLKILHTVCQIKAILFFEPDICKILVKDCLELTESLRCGVADCPEQDGNLKIVVQCLIQFRHVENIYQESKISRTILGSLLWLLSNFLRKMDNYLLNPWRTFLKTLFFRISGFVLVRCAGAGTKLLVSKGCFQFQKRLL